MKTIILSINSRYIHTLLAPRYLAANASEFDIEIIETNVNVNLQETFSQLFEKQPDVLAISCYIFNIEYVRRILQEIKLILPNVKIILGGYEVAFDSQNYIGLCDYIIKGEGDFVFAKLLEDIRDNTQVFDKIIEAQTVCQLDSIKSPYTKEYAMLGDNRILYFESTRGCPYKCSYCMSANSKRVRVFSFEYIFNNLKFLMQYSPKQIKFVDRTFNFDIKRATQIFEFLIDNFSNSQTNFHFEMAPELFDGQMIEVLKRAKAGLFQFEIGIQSYNQDTLKNVGRSANIKKIESNLHKLIALKNINIHVDLIAGLPQEDIISFAAGFDRLIALLPNCLQLGFLKVLKGSKIYKEPQGIKTFNAPPYEIVSTPMLSYFEILRLKGVEEMLELYYNSGRFNNSMQYIVTAIKSPFDFFENLANFYKKYNFNKRNTQPKTQSDMLLSFVIYQGLPLDVNALKEKIAADYKNSGNLRDWVFKNYN